MESHVQQKSLVHAVKKKDRVQSLAQKTLTKADTALVYENKTLDFFHRTILEEDQGPPLEVSS